MDFFKFFRKKKEETIIEPLVEPVVETIEEEIEEVVGSEEVLEEIIMDLPSEEPLVEDRIESITSEESPELPKETEWVPMEETIDKLKSKYQSYDLTSFLDYDYQSEGRRDGWNLHSSEFLKKKKNSLIAEFQRLVEKRIDELKDERLNCKNIVIDMRSISEQLVEKFKLRIDLCNEYITDLHSEKELSNAGQGLIRSVLWDYECGWDKGLSDYLEDKFFLNPLKRL